MCKRSADLSKFKSLQKNVGMSTSALCHSCKESFVFRSFEPSIWTLLLLQLHSERKNYQCAENVNVVVIASCVTHFLEVGFLKLLFIRVKKKAIQFW